MGLIFPLSRNKGITLLLVMTSAALIVGQMILTDANPFVLWGNWLMAGVLSVCLWYIIGRFHLGGVNECKSLAITWPMMSATLNFVYLYFDINYPYLHGLVLLLSLMAIITLVLSIWQEEQSTVRALGIGLLVGMSSTFFPHTILWLLLVPFIIFHMRATSARNVFSIITGALLGIWIVYFTLDMVLGAERSDAMLMQYIDIFQISQYVGAIEALSLWQWLYLSILALMVIVYSISAMVLGTGHSTRASASIMLLSTLSIAAVVLLCFDLSHTSLYISQLALFLCIQLTIHQANLRSSANEWWTITIITLCIGLSVPPLL